jgi:hypothetical protein
MLTLLALREAVLVLEFAARRSLHEAASFALCIMGPDKGQTRFRTAGRS